MVKGDSTYTPFSMGDAVRNHRNDQADPPDTEGVVPWQVLGHAPGLFVGVAVLGCCAAGRLEGSRAVAVPQVLFLVALVGLLALRLAGLWQARRRRSRDAGELLSMEAPAPATVEVSLLAQGLSGPRWLRTVGEVERGLLFLAALCAVIGIAGGPRSQMQLLLYLFMGMMGPVASAVCLAFLAAAATGVELAVFVLHPDPGYGPGGLALRVALLWGFAGLYRTVLRADLLQSRRIYRARIEDYRKVLREEARRFRLGGRARDVRDRREGPGEREIELAASVQAVHGSLDNLVRITAAGFPARPRALLFFLLDGPYFVLKASASASGSLVRGPIPSGKGVFGAVGQTRAPVFLVDAPGLARTVCYDRFPEEISSVAAVPVLWNEDLVGVIVADRLEARPFSEAEGRLLVGLSREIVRLMEFENILTETLAQKRAHETFHRVAHEFNRAMRMVEVAETAVTSAQEVSGAHFAALTRREEETGRDVILTARWKGVEDERLRGRRLLPDAGLVAKVVKLGYPLPESRAWRSQQVLFDPDTPVSHELSEVKVFPLWWNDNVLGTLVVGAEAANVLKRPIRQMLTVIAGHAAISLAQASLYEQMERMATTDGLTGLINHRVFQERLEEAFRRAVRYNRTLSLVLTDIDRFKRINDTFGHPVGDRVLREVAACLRESARRTDVIARYGGEEFAIIMEETGWKGAMQAAERMRHEVAEQGFSSDVEGETIRCTLSFGIATHPDHAVDKASLIGRADQALYRAKKAGRNRVVLYGDKGRE